MRNCGEARTRKGRIIFISFTGSVLCPSVRRRGITFWKYPAYARANYAEITKQSECTAVQSNLHRMMHELMYVALLVQQLETAKGYHRSFADRCTPFYMQLCIPDYQLCSCEPITDVNMANTWTGCKRHNANCGCITQQNRDRFSYLINTRARMCRCFSNKNFTHLLLKCTQLLTKLVETNC